MNTTAVSLTAGPESLVIKLVDLKFIIELK